MALLHVDLFSDELGYDCGVDVIYPQNTKRTPTSLKEVLKPPYQVLYLLHGAMRDQTSWIRFTSIERYVMEMGLVVVMPAAELSFYADQKHGQRYFSYIADELPCIMKKMFHISDRREDTFIAGLSMGGYGAFKLALQRPAQYSYAASLSGAVDLPGLMQSQGGSMDMVSDTFGSLAELAGSKDDLLWQIRQLHSAGVPIPKLYQCCGTDDFLINSNRSFYEEVKALADIEYHEEGGGHVWEFWDRNLARILDWLPIQQREAVGTTQVFRV